MTTANTSTPPRYRINRQRLVQSRVDAKLSVSDAAALLGHSTDYLAFIESGETSIPRFVLERLAEVYSCEIETLVDGD